MIFCFPLWMDTTGIAGGIHSLIIEVLRVRREYFMNNTNRKFPVGLSTCGSKPLDEAAFIQMKNAGIEALELSAASYDGFDFHAIKALCDRFDIKLWSLHLPFGPFSEIDPSSLDGTVRENTLAFFEGLIRHGAEAGITKFIVHPSGEPITDTERPERMKYAMESLDQLAQIAATCGAVIAVEDLPRTCLGNTAADILQLLSANDKLRVCFDVNHLLTEDNCEFVEKVGSKIITTHISDYDFIDEKHWLPGEGDIQWDKLFNALCNANYQGVWMYELGFEPGKSIDRRTLTYSDFRENADAIFSGQKPAAIGTRK